MTPQALFVTGTDTGVGKTRIAAALCRAFAAREAGVEIDFGVLDRAYERLRMQSEVLIVEGAGGWLAPLDAARGFADLAVHWQMEVVLVVGMRLGCLNHALLTVESIERRGLRLSGWVANSIDPLFERLPENIVTLQNRISAPCLGHFLFEPRADPQTLAQSLWVNALSAAAELS